MRNCQPGAYYADAGRRVAEADLRHISVSDHPTTDIRETCTWVPARVPVPTDFTTFLKIEDLPYTMPYKKVIQENVSCRVSCIP